MAPHGATVHTSWTHIGQLWTNGEPYLAIDALLLRSWRGMSDDEDDRVVAMSPEETSIAVANSTALLVGAGGVVRDDSWMEVFEFADGSLASVSRRPGLPRNVESSRSRGSARSPLEPVRIMTHLPAGGDYRMDVYPVTIGGPGVRLRDFREGDLDGCMSIVGDPQVTWYLSFDTRTRTRDQRATLLAADLARATPSCVGSRNCSGRTRSGT